MASRSPRRKRLTASPVPAPPPLAVCVWPRPALTTATAISTLLITALLANILVLQTYERVLMRHGDTTYLAEPLGGASRSLRLFAGDNNGNSYQQQQQLNQTFSRTEEPEGLKIAWLMSFPNSGTSFTSRLVRDAVSKQCRHAHWRDRKGRWKKFELTTKVFFVSDIFNRPRRTAPATMPTKPHRDRPVCDCPCTRISSMDHSGSNRKPIRSSRSRRNTSLPR